MSQKTKQDMDVQQVVACLNEQDFLQAQTNAWLADPVAQEKVSTRDAQMQVLTENFKNSEMSDCEKAEKILQKELEFCANGLGTDNEPSELFLGYISQLQNNGRIVNALT